MEIVDTHSHLYLPEFEEDLNGVITRSKEAGVIRVYLPNIDSGTIVPMNSLVKNAPEFFFPMMGLHPCSVRENYKEEMEKIRQELYGERKYVAVGEIGIDLYWDKTFAVIQEEVFLEQLEWGRELDLPVVIHSRESFTRICELLEGLPEGGSRGVFHCFSGNEKDAERALDLGFYLGIGGVVTFKNSGLDKVVSGLPLEKLIVETDAPYLAPVPRRGKRNESSYIINIVEKIAEVKGVAVEEVARVTTKNALELFDPEGRDS